MSQPNDLSRSLIPFEHTATLVAVIELSQSSWLIAGFGGIGESSDVTAVDAAAR